MKASPWAAATMILALAAAWKLSLVAADVFPFNADEAVVALMARHILQGERPIFFYGQAYMGSLDAFLVASGFLILGQHVWVVRLIQVFLYLGLIITTMVLGQAITRSWKTGLLAGLLMAIPPVNVTLYTTISLGGYGEALLIGNLILILALRIANDLERPVLWGLWGLLVGSGLWANGLTLIYSLPSGVLLLVLITRRVRSQGWGRLWKGFPWGLPGLLIGSAPWWIFALSHGLQGLLTELLGGAVAVEQGPWATQVLNHLVSFFLLGGTVSLGFRPPWEIRWLGLPLIPFVLMVWAGALYFAIARMRASSHRTGGWLLLGMALTLAGGFIFTSFGVDPSGRYFIPLVVPLSLAAAFALQHLLQKPIWQTGVVALILVYQGWGTLDCALHNPPGITTQFNAITQVDTRYQQQLIDFLTSQGEMTGYSNYWVSYPTTFLSGEKVILVPRLPYHEDLRYTPRDDRYAPYDTSLDASQHSVYVTTHNPALDQAIVDGLHRIQVTWQEQQIGDYHVYYDLSRKVLPQELGLGGAP